MSFEDIVAPKLSTKYIGAFKTFSPVLRASVKVLSFQLLIPPPVPVGFSLVIISFKSWILPVVDVSQNISNKLSTASVS